jgi:hypothetical protein
MSKHDVIVIDGRAYDWRRLCDLRKAQMEARRAAQGRQLALFELKRIFDRRRKALLPGFTAALTLNSMA